MIRSPLRACLVLVVAFAAAGIAPAAPAGPGLGAGVTSVASLPARAIAWSPDGSSLLFSNADALRIADAPGFASPRIVVRTPAHPADQVAWTPDGAGIVFVAARPGDGWDTIWTARANGTNVRDLLPPGSPVLATGIRSVQLAGWDDRGRLVFWIHCGTSCFEFFALDLASGRTTRLCYGSDFAAWGDGTPRGAYTDWWGLTALIERVPGVDDEPMAGCTQVFSRRDDDPHRVTRAFDAWAPGGRTFAYTAWTPVRSDDLGTGSGTPTLAVYELASGKRRVLAERTAWGAFSPDGTRVAATRLVPAGSGSGDLYGTLVVLDAATGQQLAAAPLGRAPRQDWLWRDDTPRSRPAWSPDGAFVVVHDSARGLVRVDAASGAALVLTRRHARARWAPGSARRLAVTMPPELGDGPPYVEGHGIDHELPPYGSDDRGSAAERAERYYGFLRDRARTRPRLDSDHERWFMESWARALWALRRKEEAEALLRELLATSVDADERAARLGDLGWFLRCTGRVEEGLRVDPPPRPSPVPPDGRETLGGRLLTPEEAASLPEEDPCDHIDPTRPRKGEPDPEPAPTYVIVFP